MFDIIGTCFSLERTRDALVELGSPPSALEMWFAQSLRDSFGLSHSGGYVPLKQMLQADLPRAMFQLGLTPTPQDLASVLETLGDLDPRPDLGQAVGLLKDRGWRLVALTMGSVASTRQLLAKAGVLSNFDDLRSCDEISITKPNPAAYRLADGPAGGVTWMIAAHAWDIAGANRAGLRTAFVTTVERSYPDAYPRPDVIAGLIASGSAANPRRVGRQSGLRDADHVSFAVPGPSSVSSGLTFILARGSPTTNCRTTRERGDGCPSCRATIP